MSTERQGYRVAGLSCTDCAATIQAGVERLEGVERCDINVGTGVLTFQTNAPDFDVASVAKLVADTGHRLVTEGAEPPPTETAFVPYMLASAGTRLTMLATALTGVGLALSLTPLPMLVRALLYAAAIALGGVPVVRRAHQEILVTRSLGINSLMTIAVVGALVIGEWSEAAIVVVLFSIGEALEGFAADRARGALDSLLSLAPATALRLDEGGQTTEVPVADLALGNEVLIRPGDRVSVDGQVVAGSSGVDQAAITGESVPVDKVPGDRVYAGSMNTSGALTVEVTHLAEDTTLSRMVELVRDSQSAQAPVQRFVDRFARVYTPAVTVVAMAVAAIPPLFLGQPFWGGEGWLLRALELLVIACPCALVISTPVSVVSALTRAASQGVLIKGGRALEQLSRVRVFAFDKTGTLTAGSPVATDVESVCDHQHDDAIPGLDHGLAYAAALESQSSHPLARAIVAEAQARNVPAMASEDVRALGGRGMTGRVHGRYVTVGSHAYFDEAVPHRWEVCARADELALQGKTVVMVGCEDDVCSVVALADTARAESREAIAALRRAGYRTVMLTGDNHRAAQLVADQVGVDAVKAELLPEDKVKALRALQAIEGAVAMVGDGVNDAPALAQASVGIAMGAAGSDQAMQTADVVLMGDDLRQLPETVRLSRRTNAAIRTNIAFALAVKALVFGLALAGVATLWMAIAADVGASLAVIVNGARLRRQPASEREEGDRSLISS